jgi:GNAT superfamily N-acetyltransferase
MNVFAGTSEVVPPPSAVRLIELDRVADGDWQQVIAGEPQPFGAIGEGLRWREKSHNLGLFDDTDSLVALAGLVRAKVRVADARIQVAGIGGVIVTRAARGHGFARVLIERLLQIAHELGPERAMLFCLPANVGLYAKFGFQPIEEPVWAPQPEGLVEIPLCAMWRPLARAAGWPEGEVELLDEPF